MQFLKLFRPGKIYGDGWNLSSPTFAENITFFDPSDEMDFESE